MEGSGEEGAYEKRILEWGAGGAQKSPAVFPARSIRSSVPVPWGGEQGPRAHGLFRNEQ